MSATNSRTMKLTYAVILYSLKPSAAVSRKMGKIYRGYTYKRKGRRKGGRKRKEEGKRVEKGGKEERGRRKKRGKGPKDKGGMKRRRGKKREKGGGGGGGGGGGEKGGGKIMNEARKREKARARRTQPHSLFLFPSLPLPSIKISIGR